MANLRFVAVCIVISCDVTFTQHTAPFPSNRKTDVSADKRKNHPEGNNVVTLHGNNLYSESHIQKHAAIEHDNFDHNVSGLELNLQRQHTAPTTNALLPRVSSDVCSDIQFQCKYKIACISIDKRCSGVFDCEDHSDEEECVHIDQYREMCRNGSNEQVYRCSSGRCIPLTDVCNSIPRDIGFGNGSNSQLFVNLTCVPSGSTVCSNSSHVDLQDKCEHGSIQPRPRVNGSNAKDHFEHSCPVNMFQCRNGQCVAMETRCDNGSTNSSGCSDRSDDESCEHSVCGEGWFRCSNGQCVAVQKRCDSKTIDCNDGSDETGCNNTVGCLDSQFRCNNGQCLPDYYGRCNGVTGTPSDCSDGSDEVGCPLSKCPTGYFRCHSGQCLEHDICSIKNTYRCLAHQQTHCGKLDCPPYYFRCKTGRCLHPTSRCDDRKDCPDGEDEKHCGQPVCRDDQLNCVGHLQYCVQKFSECDGNRDCEYGEDEESCTFNMQSCPSNLTCHNSGKCIRQFQLCDTNSDCPFATDERNCATHCPFGCECFEDTIDCSDDTKTAVNATSQIWPLEKLRTIYYTRSQLWLPMIVALNLSRSVLTAVPVILLRYFPNLKVLDLSSNQITKVSAGSFEGINAFFHLDLSNNWIIEIEDCSFKGIRINHLYLQENPIKYFSSNLFSGLAADGTVHTPAYKYCCVRPAHLPEENCFPKADEFSSCSDLMKHISLRIFLWVIGVFALLGNAFAIIFRLKYERSTLDRSYGVFVSNLCVSDFLMGVYMITIATVDMIFRQKYITVADIWKHSVWCKFAGIVSMVSSESSVLFIFIITVDRFVTIRYPFGQLRFSKNLAIILSVGVWCLAILIAIFPLLLYSKFYSENGVCVALPLKPIMNEGWQYSVSVYLGLNCALFLLITAGQFMIYYEIISSRRKNQTFNQRRDDMRVARRLLLVVLTDHFCWIPIGCLTTMALCGHGLSDTSYTWVVVMVLPVNSALNPFLYTLMSKLCK